VNSWYSLYVQHFPAAYLLCALAWSVIRAVCGRIHARLTPLLLIRVYGVSTATTTLVCITTHQACPTPPSDAEFEDLNLANFSILAPTMIAKQIRTLLGLYMPYIIVLIMTIDMARESGS